MTLTRVAVVGTGIWGRQHARIFAGRQDTELIAIVGRDVTRTEARAREYNTTPYVEMREMLVRERPDLVSVALPNEGHFEPTLELIRAGVPLLVEKPLVFDLSEADQLLAEAAERNLFFAINFNHRYAEPVRRAHKSIEEGALGDITFASWRFGGEPSLGTHPHAQLIETQCHGFDMLEYLCGPIGSLMAQMTNKKSGFASAVLALEFVNGAVGSLIGSYDTSYAYPRTHYLEVSGLKGRLTIEDTVRRFTLSRTGDETSEVWEAGYFNDRDRDFTHTFDRHADEILTAFRYGHQPPVHARAGRRALELAIAAIRSFETGTRIDVARRPTKAT